VKANIVLLACLASACSSSRVATERVQLESLTFDVPANWERVDSTLRRGVVSAEWRPEDNEHHESLLVIRTTAATLSKGAGAPELMRLVREAQTGLARARVAVPRQLATRRGFVGAVVEVDFVPRQEI
jgi:hypothetical protein